ncbi:MAG: hypothetical protein AB7T49_18975 [Oligoflexales bacterium]
MSTKTALLALGLFASTLGFSQPRNYGVSLEETLEGNWISSDSSTVGSVVSAMTLSHPNLSRIIIDPTLDINGKITVDGLTESAVPVTGKLSFSFLPTEIMTYVLNFCLPTSECYSIEGKKHVINPTAISGPVRDANGTVLGTAYLQFDAIRDFVSMIRSIKITHGNENE